MYKNMVELRDAIQNNMLRRLKEDKLKDLPNVAHKTIRIDMNNAQKKLYKGVKEGILEDLQDSSLEKVPDALAKLIRLQQIVDSPALVGGSVNSNKIKALDELLEEFVTDGKQKVIVFSRFKELIEILQERYSSLSPAVITGDVDSGGRSENSAVKVLKKQYGEKWDSIPEEEKRKMVEKEMTSERQLEVYKFQNDPNCKLFLGTSAACREGLTLTAATHVIFLDCEWSPAYVEQAYSRAHRIGQKNAVTVYYLVCNSTIDEYVQKVLTRKENMAQTMLDNVEYVQEIGQQRARHMIAELIGENIVDVA